MKLDYGTLLSKEPIATELGVINPPTLLKIRKEIGFEVFSLYEMYLRLTPKIYYTLLLTDGKDKWKDMPKEQRKSIKMYDIILKTDELKVIYEEIFNFFFKEKVIHYEGYFLILNKDDIDDINLLSIDDIRGIIHKGNFDSIINILQQICGFDVEDEDSKKPLVFKNNRAKEVYEQIYGKDDADEINDKEDKPVNYDLTIPNLISAVSNSHPTISPLNVWGLTVFQLVDSFHRLIQNKSYDINKTSVAVWGDEEGTFQNDQWFKNKYDVRESTL